MNQKRPRRAAPATVALILSLCATAALPGTSAGSDAVLSDFARPRSVPASRSNPITPEKVSLGLMLFFDSRLSGSGVISSATCHNPAWGWSDALPKGLGHMGGRLNDLYPIDVNVGRMAPDIGAPLTATMYFAYRDPGMEAIARHLSAHWR